MARIPEAEVQGLREDISVQRLIADSGIALKKSGKDLTGRGPLHEDDTASLVVTPAKNLWQCFGCGLGGGPMDWVMKSRGVSFRHAVALDADDQLCWARWWTTTTRHLSSPPRRWPTWRAGASLAMQLRRRSTPSSWVTPTVLRDCACRRRRVILGSAPLFMPKGLTESMPGRFEIKRMGYWQFKEMREAFGSSLDQFIYYGGYPVRRSW